MTYNEFQKLAVITRTIEAQAPTEVEAVRVALLAVEKSDSMTLNQITAAAWKIFKKSK